MSGDRGFPRSPGVPFLELAPRMVCFIGVVVYQCISSIILQINWCVNSQVDPKCSA